VNEKQFPDGMKKLADDIRALGFRPGIWIPPFGTGNTEFYETHKDWFLHNENGQPIVSWNGKYMLDPTVAEAREHLKKMFRTASSEWGYEFFKIDGMSGNTIYTYEKPEVRVRFHDPSCPNPFELCLQAYREGIGEDRIFLACMGHTSGVEVRYADASRLGADIVAANQPVKWANVMNQGRCTINQIFTHNIVLIADPDTLLVHDLPIEEARTSATIVALPGQLTFFGDKLAGLSKEQMKVLQQTLPVADVRPAALYPHFSMLPIWNLSVRHEKLGSYNVVALFNWNDLPQTIDVSMNDLGLPASSENHWLGYEFWTQKPVKINNNLLSMNVPPHSVRVVVIQPNRNIPQWAGSDRHIAQNGIELLDYQWNAQEKTLRGKIQLVGNFPLTARLHIPENYRFTAAAANIPQRPIVQNEPNNILAVTFQSEQSVAADFEIKFHEE